MSNSWRQYGGMKKTDNFQSLTVGTLVADQILLRENYTGSILFRNSVSVIGDVVNNGYIITEKNVLSEKDSYVGNNSYLNKKLFFGYYGTLFNDLSLNINSYKEGKVPILDISNSKPYGPLDISWSYLAGNQNGIGINTSTPSSIFTVYGINNQSNLFSAISQNQTAKSIIAQNNNNRGISVTSTVNSKQTSFIDFFNNNDISSGFYDTRLRSTDNSFNLSSSVIELSANVSNNFFSNGNTNINSKGFLNISSNLYNAIDTCGNTIITANNTNISSLQNTNIYSARNTDIISLLRISPKTRFSNSTLLDNSSNNFYNETATIFDISYQDTILTQTQPLLKTGNALTMVANDSSSITFLNAVSTQRNGFSIGGGTFYKDSTKSIGTIGLRDICGNYTPNINILSGTSSLIYPTTLGVNTFIPKTDKYVVDINGPLHVTNGVIKNVFSISFEILQTVFSSDGSTGIAVGTQSSQYDTSTNTYIHNIAYTNNGGQTWNLSRVSKKGSIPQNDLEIKTQKLSIYLVNNNFCIISSSEGLLFISRDGGITWTNYTLYDLIVNASNTINSKGSLSNTKITNVFIQNIENNNGYRVILNCNYPYSHIKVFETDTQFYVKRPFSVGIGATVATTDISYICTLSFDLTPITSDVSVNNINGNDSNVFFATTSGLYKVQNDISNAYNINTILIYNSKTITLNKINDTPLIQGNQLFNTVLRSNTNTNCFIAIGKSDTNTIIKTTQDATIWTNTFTLNNALFNQGHIYDTSNAILVGNKGTMYYSNNWLTNSWKQVPIDLLNSAGIGYELTNTDISLNSVIIKDLNTVIILKTTQNNNIQSQGSNYGQSSIYYCFLPKLFNSANNNIFDISGNMSIDGDIKISENGNIYSNNSNLYVGNSSNITHQDVIIGSNNSRIIVQDAHFNGRIDSDLNIFESGNIYAKNPKFYVGDGSNVTHQDIILGSNNSRIIVQDAHFNGRIDSDLNIFESGNIYAKNPKFYVGDGSNVTHQDIILGSNNSRIIVQDAHFNGRIDSDLNIFESGNIYAKNSKFYIGDSSNVTHQDITIGNNNSRIIIQDAHFNGRIDSDLNIFQSGNIYAKNSNLYIGDGSNVTHQDITIGSNNSRVIIQDACFNGFIYSQTPELHTISKQIATTEFVFNEINFFKQNPSSITSPVIIGDLTFGATPSTTIDMSRSSLLLNIPMGNLFLNVPTGYANLLAQNDISLNTTNGNISLISNNGNFDIFSKNDISINSTNGNINLSSKNGDGQLNIKGTAHVTGNLIVDGTIDIVGEITQTTTHIIVSEEMDICANNMTAALKVTQLGSNLLNSDIAYFNSIDDSSGIPIPTVIINKYGVSIGNNIPKPTSTSCTLDVSGNARISSDLSLNAKLSVNNDVLMNSRLVVNDDVSFNNRLFVGNDLSINSNLNVRELITCNRLIINNAGLIDSSPNVSGFLFSDLITASGGIISNNDISLNNRLLVSGDSLLKSRMFVIGDVSMNGNLYAANKTILEGDVSLNSKLLVQTTCNIGGDVSFNSKLQVQNDVSMNSSLDVSGRAQFFGNTYFKNTINNVTYSLDISENINTNYNINSNGCIFQFIE